MMLVDDAGDATGPHAHQGIDGHALEFWKGGGAAGGSGCFTKHRS